MKERALKQLAEHGDVAERVEELTTSNVPNKSEEPIGDIIPISVALSEMPEKKKLAEERQRSGQSNASNAQPKPAKFDGDMEFTREVVEGTVLYHRKRQSTSQRNAKPQSEIFLDRGYKGMARYCLKINEAREQQFIEQDREFESGDEVNWDHHCTDVGYETPTEDDYKISDLPDLKVGNVTIKDFRHGDGMKKMLGKKLPRYKHALRVAPAENVIAMPNILANPWDEKTFIKNDPESDDTSSEASDVSCEVYVKLSQTNMTINKTMLI